MKLYYEGRGQSQGTFSTRKNAGTRPNSVGSFSVSSKNINIGGMASSSGSGVSPVNRFRCLTPAGQKGREVCFWGTILFYAIIINYWHGWLPISITVFITLLNILMEIKLISQILSLMKIVTNTHMLGSMQ